MFSSPKIKVEEDKDRIYELFSAFDIANNNTIAVSEVPVLIRVLGLAIKEADIQPLLKNWTDKNDERVTYEDFLPVYHVLKEKYEKKTNNPDAASISSNNRFVDRVVSMSNLKEATQVPCITPLSATSESSQSNEVHTIILLLKVIAVLLFFIFISNIWFSFSNLQPQTFHSGPSVSSMKELSEIRKMVVSLESKLNTLIVFITGLIGGFLFGILVRGKAHHETEKSSKANKQSKKTLKDSKKEMKQNINIDKENDEKDENNEGAEDLGEYNDNDIDIKVTRVGLLFSL